MIPRDAERSELVSPATESRAHPRVKIHSLAYIELGEANAGLILNISESGIAVQAVEALSSGSFPRMQFRLPKTEALIQVAGKVVWQIKPKKEAGIEFDGLSEQTRLAIRKWIAAEESRQDASEKAHLKPLSDPPGPAGQKTAVQIYPSERGDEETVAVIPDVPFNPAEFAPAPAGISRLENRATPARFGPALHSPPSLAPPRAPMRIPDRWRTVPQGSSSHAAQPSSILSRQTQIFSTSAWNLGATDMLAGPKHRKSRWPFVAAIVLLGAVGTAGMMALDPGAMNTASIAAMVDRVTARLKHYPPSQTSSAADAPAAQSQAGNSLTATAGANPNSPTQPSQAPPTAQPQTPVAPPQNANPQPSASATAPSSTQSEAQTAANSANAASSPAGVQGQSANPSDEAQSQPAAPAAPPSVARNGADRGGLSAQHPPQTQTLSGAGMAQTAASPTAPADKYARNDQPSAYPESAQSHSGESMPAANRASSQRTVATNSRASSSRNQIPARPRRDQSPLEAWRAQTELPTGAASSTARSPRRAPATQQNEVQDAYARSSPYVTSRGANVPQNYTAQQQISLVDVPGYRSVAVPTSMPLAGVPSGSVAATSQFRAIWVPARLTWARQYLPGNLGVGQLLSSYSPAYPIQAARDGVEGTVKLDVTVDTDGTVRSVRVLSGPPMLSSAAVAAVRDWRYAETFLAGDPVETQQYVTMFFRLTAAQ